jgi:hypothetical protein
MIEIGITGGCCAGCGVGKAKSESILLAGRGRESILTGSRGWPKISPSWAGTRTNLGPPSLLQGA